MQNKINAVILTEGGKGIGFGHLTRSMALAQALKSQGISPKIFVNGDSSIKKMLFGGKAEVSKWQAKKGTLDNVLSPAGIVIVDSYLAKEDLYLKVSRSAAVPVYIDDMKRLDYPAGVVINSAVKAKALSYPVKHGIKYLLGAEYALLRKEFLRVADKQINKACKSILITVGGSDNRNLVPRIMRFLKQRYPGWIKYVVIGKSFNNIEGIKKAADDKSNLVYFPDAEKMKKLMLDCDISISSGGQTLFELARVGVPTAVISVADNQNNNINGFLKAGFIEYAGAWNSTGLLSNLDKKIKLIQGYQSRIRKSRIGRRLIDGKGGARIVKALLSLFKENNLKFRPAAGKDSRDLWLWRNHPLVRKWSFNKGSISYKGHCEWFNKKIAGKESFFYIAENGNKQKIGQIRFDYPKGNNACVSVNLNPRFFNKGFGSKLIRNGTLVFLRDHKDARKIEANVVSENTASINAFRKAGYKFTGERRINEEKASLFRFSR